MTSARAEDLVIAGLVPLSTVDWPGTLAASLFLQGCPWRCTFCHNQDILDPAVPGAVTWREVLELLERRESLLDAVVFSGGEATLQHALVPAMREVNERGFRVGLHTGGAYPRRIRQAVTGGVGGNPLVDWVGFDLKAPPHLYRDTVQVRSDAWRKVRESFEILAAARVAMEVRTTVTPALLPALPAVVDTFAALADLAGVGGRRPPRHTRASAGTRRGHARSLSGVPPAPGGMGRDVRERRGGCDGARPPPRRTC